MGSKVDPRFLQCPYICPTNREVVDRKVYKEAGELRNVEDPFCAPYIPGMIVPREPKVCAPGFPPYLPQPTDSTSGDMLGMGPIGPWAPGHLDWTPQSGMTGVRPVVDKYSITRYSTGDWRKNNQRILTPRATAKATQFEIDSKRDVGAAFQKIHDKTAASTKELSDRVETLSKWKKKVRQAVEEMTNELNTLEDARQQLKGASKILMLPEAISRECLELRTHRLEPDLVRDDAEQELIKEVAIVGEIRKVFNDTLMKVEKQLLEDRAAKAAIEQDWSDKYAALKVDYNNLNLGIDSNLLLHHAGVSRWPENATTLRYWEHFCNESIKNCNEVRDRSKKLRENLKEAIVKGSLDMKTQADRTNQALGETIDATHQCCHKLEQNLKENLQKIADIENLIDYLKDTFRKIDDTDKLAMTRLKSRNYDRDNVENCQDKAQYSLMEEAQLVKDTGDSLKGKLREAEGIRAELMKYRADLEKEIACKRKSLNIDEDRLHRVRAHMPSPDEFENN